ncbi:hypothetical protein TrRE_jg13347 [Triparma retinervis]|uniref:WW domain-containing protein n=1 Tax=Triparma retinervis TaxID=2557542 RepID=A0A9W7APR1_9STRA|nr:hypothetical protein TrRE_jg13347 [Triparma retinervis]
MRDILNKFRLCKAIQKRYHNAFHRRQLSNGHLSFGTDDKVNVEMTKLSDGSAGSFTLNPVVTKKKLKYKKKRSTLSSSSFGEETRSPSTSSQNSLAALKEEGGHMGEEDEDRERSASTLKRLESGGFNAFKGKGNDRQKRGRKVAEEAQQAPEEQPFQDLRSVLTTASKQAREGLTTAKQLAKDGLANAKQQAEEAKATTKMQLGRARESMIQKGDAIIKKSEKDYYEREMKKKPADTTIKKIPQYEDLPPGPPSTPAPQHVREKWEEHTDHSTGRKYRHNTVTNESEWLP